MLLLLLLRNRTGQPESKDDANIEAASLVAVVAIYTWYSQSSSVCFFGSKQSNE